VTKVAERLLQQTLGEARYKELLEQSKSKGRKKRKAREQATPHGSGSHTGKKPKESDASSSSSPSTTASPTKSSTNTERANDDGNDGDDDVIEWEGPTSDGSNYLAQQQQPEIASSAKPELDAQVIEILRALGIDVDVYETLLSRARPCC
jgi:DNA-directed RNA polymerase specialized sigma54-like protein